MQRQIPPMSRDDPYRSQNKPQGTPECVICHAISVKGRWQPRAKVAKPRLGQPGVRSSVKKLARASGITLRNAARSKTLCPACRQLQDRYAMGVIELHGHQWKAHSEQVFDTIAKTEEIARARNDQERVLWWRTYRGVTKVYVTLPELARQIGHELQRTFKGKAEFRRTSEEPYLRVIWDADRPSPRSPAARATQVERGRRSRHYRHRSAR